MHLHKQLPGSHFEGILNCLDNMRQDRGTTARRCASNALDGDMKTTLKFAIGLGMAGIALTACSGVTSSQSSSASMTGGSATSTSPSESTVSAPGEAANSPSKSGSESVLTVPAEPVESATMNPDDMNKLALQVQDVADRVVGRSEGDAMSELEMTHPNGTPIVVRVVHRDGQDFPVTMDYSPNRVNLWIDNGVVTKVSVG